MAQLATALLLIGFLLGLAPAVAFAECAPAVTSCSAAPADARGQGSALDFDALETRLRDTPAIGFLTKVALKTEVDEFIGELARFHDGAGGALSRLRERYNALVTKVLSLLRDGDPVLAQDVSMHRETVWQSLADAGRFAKLRAQGRMRL